jgi:hypothetical protein
MFLSDVGFYLEMVQTYHEIMVMPTAFSSLGLLAMAVPEAT